MLKIFLGIMLFQFGGLILPGPDFAMVFRHAIIKGTKDGLFCASGITCGVMLNLLVTFLIGTLLYEKYHLLYLCFIMLGLLFLYYVSISLIYNSFRLLKQKQQTDTPLDNNNLGSNNSFITGLLTNLSNVKAIVFFSSILPLVNQLNTPFILLTWIGMGFMAWAWFSIVVFLFTQAKIRHAFLAKIHIIELIIGSAIFFFASAIFYEAIFKYIFT